MQNKEIFKPAQEELLNKCPHCCVFEETKIHLLVCLTNDQGNQEIFKPAQEEYKNYCWLLKCPVVVCFEKPKLTGSLSSILPENMLALFTKLCDSYKPMILDNSINGYSK